MGTIENATIKLACMWPSWNVHHRQDPTRLNPHATPTIKHDESSTRGYAPCLREVPFTPCNSHHHTHQPSPHHHAASTPPCSWPPRLEACNRFHTLYTCATLGSFGASLAPLLLPALNKENSETLERYQNQK
jgi:hypothetical protein